MQFFLFQRLRPLEPTLVQFIFKFIRSASYLCTQSAVPPQQEVRRPLLVCILIEASVAYFNEFLPRIQQYIAMLDVGTGHLILMAHVLCSLLYKKLKLVLATRSLSVI